MEICIGKSNVGDNYPTFIVAEMSANHGHDLNKAIELGYIDDPKYLGIAKAHWEKILTKERN